MMSTIIEAFHRSFLPRSYWWVICFLIAESNYLEPRESKEQAKENAIEWFDVGFPVTKSNGIYGFVGIRLVSCKPRE